MAMLAQGLVSQAVVGVDSGALGASMPAEITIQTTLSMF